MHLICFLIILLSSAWAHQTSLTPEGKEMFWTNPNVPLVIRTNTNDLTAAQVNSIILESMNQWNMSSSAKVTSVSASNNEIKFVANYPYGNAVLGVTELSFNTQGAIQRATIILNDDYTFKPEPGLYPSKQVFLGDVVTHELGHLFGMGHSEVLDSTMFYSSFSGQSTVGLDDQTGIRQKYDSSSYGTISGVVRGGNDIGVLGVHVQAISRRTGKSSGAVSDENGEFKLGGLNLQDTYYLYTSPVKNIGSLPGYFSNVQTKFCPASYVGSFFSQCGKDNEGKPQGISLTSLSPEVDVGIVTINCSLNADENYNAQKINSNFNKLNIFTYDSARPQKVEQAFVGWFRNPSTSSWSEADIFEVDYRTHPTGPLYVKFSIVSFPLGTQLEYQVDVKSNAQNFITGSRSLQYSSVTQTYNTDFEVLIPLSSDATRNLFEIKIRSRKLGSSYTAATFPSFDSFSSGTYLPYLVVADLWEDQGPQRVPVINTESLLSDNAACLDAPFTYAVSRAQDVSSDSDLSGQAAAAGASCGTIDPPSNGPGSSMPLMTLGFILSLFASTLFKGRKKFLS